MSFFSRVNQPETIRRAKVMLKDYRVYKQISKRVSFPSLQSPTITDMPTGHAYGNTNERKLVKYLSRQEEAKLYCATCVKTIEALANEIYRKILTDTYIAPVLHDSVIWDELGYSKRRYYDLKNESLLAYSEVCPGKPSYDHDGMVRYDDILVYKTDI